MYDASPGKVLDMKLGKTKVMTTKRDDLININVGDTEAERVSKAINFIQEIRMVIKIITMRKFEESDLDG